MTPVITHVRANIPELTSVADQHSLKWTFDASMKQLGPDFYRKIIPMHPVLNMEYSVLCNQLRHYFSAPHEISQEQLIEHLTAALMLAELLEHIHLHYLIVPREVVRLRRHQEIFRSLLSEVGYSFAAQQSNTAAVAVGLSLSQQIRENTAFANWYRLLLTRSKRVLNFLDLVGTGSDGFRNFVAGMDKYTNPFFAYLAWCFFIPRLSTNLFLLIKHTLPGAWMGDEEKSLGWRVRFEAQLQRRWFELVNDILWVTLGLLNCFVLLGALAPVSVYLTLCVFTIDVACASYRAYIELKRLYNLQEEYTNLYHLEQNEEHKIAIKAYQKFIEDRITFEQVRLGLSVGATSSIFIAMFLAMPALAVSPVLPLVGACLLIAIWVVHFLLARKIEEYRPNDIIEMPSNVSKLGFFAHKQETPPVLPYRQVSNPEVDEPGAEGLTT